VLSSLHSLSSLLLLLLLLRAVPVLAPADGAAWVRAALVHDFPMGATGADGAGAGRGRGGGGPGGISLITCSDQKVT